MVIEIIYYKLRGIKSVGYSSPPLVLLLNTVFKISYFIINIVNKCVCVCVCVCVCLINNILKKSNSRAKCRVPNLLTFFNIVHFGLPGVITIK